MDDSPLTGRRVVANMDWALPPRRRTTSTAERRYQFISNAKHTKTIRRITNCDDGHSGENGRLMLDAHKGQVSAPTRPTATHAGLSLRIPICAPRKANRNPSALTLRGVLVTRQKRRPSRLPWAP